MIRQQVHYKKVDQKELDHRLKPGRHLCDCQARLHSLIKNCLNCGRVVCAQEGSGPCFYCQSLVCTSEERKILDQNSEQSRDMLKKLLGKNVSNHEQPPPGFSGFSLIGKSMNNANEYRDKLLIADKSEDITRVYDLDNDYFTLESNPYLTFEERDSIVRRKDELRDLRRSERNKFVISLDIENRTVEEEKRSKFETASDPIIQSIIRNSLNRKQNLENCKLNFGEEDTGQILLKQYVPKYVGSLSKVAVKNDSLKISKIKMRRIRGTVHCIALKQPFASFIVSDERENFFLPSKKQHFLRGPIVIAALSDTQKLTLFNDFNFSQQFSLSQENLPKNALIGRAFLKDCITWKEFKEEYAEDSKLCPVDDNFVLIFHSVSKFSQDIPFVCSSELFELDKNVTARINQMLDTSLFDEFDLSSV